MSRQAAAVGFRAHTGWAAVVAVTGDLERPGIVFRGRVELADPTGRVRKNAYHAARSLEPAAAAELVEAAGRVAAEQAAAALAWLAGRAEDDDAVVRSCAVVVGPAGDFPLETTLRSHARVHAAEGRLYQRALLEAAEASGLEAIAVPKGSIWEQGEAVLGIAGDELRDRLARLRQDVGPPWAEDQRLAALAAWIALAARIR